MNGQDFIRSSFMADFLIVYQSLLRYFADFIQSFKFESRLEEAYVQL